MFARSVSRSIIGLIRRSRYSLSNSDRSYFSIQRSTTIRHPNSSFTRFCSDVPEDNGSSSVSFDLQAPMMAIFTCRPCGNRHSYQFSKVSYNNGVVIVRCPSCKSLHLVADNLKWFSDEKKNLETISKEHGIHMQKKTGTLEETLESLGFSGKDATKIAKKKGTRIKLSDEVIQAIPDEFKDNDSMKKE